MRDLVLSGRIVDAILLLVAVELVVLTLIRHRTGRGPGGTLLLPNLLAGCALLLALRAALGGAAWPWSAAWLAAAGVAHVADLAMRWNPRSR
jgi:hypothetical protein